MTSAASATPLVISGALTMGRVAEAMQRVTRLAKRQDMVIDLSGVTDADSSAVAFLLNCVRLARQNGKAARFTAVPETIMTLADIYGLKAVIADATLSA